MSAIIFVGPTLRADEVREFLDAECRPPVAQGDVYQAALRMPRCIGIIDGYFDGVPSVWHKEILWAMAQGIQVFGSASMGALRAAELADFGMKGVGRIFEDYRSGRLTDDDEVAVLHAPAELDFQPLSEPMVSIRATVAQAAAAGMLADDMPKALLDLAKAMHYRARSWDAILTAAEGVPTLARRLAGFAEWLHTGRIDAKRADAIAMLKAIAEGMEAGEAAAPVGYSFEQTHVWQSLTERIEARNLGAGETARMVLDELRLDRNRFQRLRDRAALRNLALEAARRRGAEADRSALVQEMSLHRKRNRLLRRRDLAEWLAANDLDESEYEWLLAESHLIEMGAALPPETLARHLLAELKWTGGYDVLRRRAIDKARVLDAAEAAPAGPSPADRLKPLIWYFEEHLGEAVPGDLDRYARLLGLEGRHELYRILEREYLYWLSGQERQEGGRPE